MKQVVNDERLMLRICELYYNQNLGQKEIAGMMKLSRPTISRLLINAREKGIVRIVISDLEGRHHLELEQELEKKYALKKAIITNSYDEKERLHSELGHAAARWLETILKNGDVVGVAMGSTLTHIAQYVTADYLRALKFVPMLGGIGSAAIELHSNYIAEALAKAFHGEALALHAPAMVSRVQVKTELLQEESIAKTLSLTSNLDVAVNGIGAPDESSTIIVTGYITREMMGDFNKYDICGDICMNFFDKNGNYSSENNERVLGINIEMLRKIPWSLGVAGGTQKAAAIRGALAGKYINALITDFECAKLLLQ